MLTSQHLSDCCIDVFSREFKSAFLELFAAGGLSMSSTRLLSFALSHLVNFESIRKIVKLFLPKGSVIWTRRIIHNSKLDEKKTGQSCLTRSACGGESCTPCRGHRE